MSVLSAWIAALKSLLIPMDNVSTSFVTTIHSYVPKKLGALRSFHWDVTHDLFVYRANLNWKSAAEYTSVWVYGVTLSKNTLHFHSPKYQLVSMSSIKIPCFWRLIRQRDDIYFENSLARSMPPNYIWILSQAQTNVCWLTGAIFVITPPEHVAT